MYFLLQVAASLASVDEWQFDSFKLMTASAGRPLSCLAFFLFKRMKLMSTFRLNEAKFVRFLIRVEDGYPDNPYHCRSHAADVLRSFHAVLHRGGVLKAVVASAKARLNSGDLDPPTLPPTAVRIDPPDQVA